MKQSTSFTQVTTNLLNVLQRYTKGIRFLLVMFLTLTVTTNAWGAEDEIDYEATKSDLNSTATNAWKDFNLTGASGATYIIHSLGTKNTSNALQWNTNGYLYQKKSGGKLKSVTIKGTNGKSVKIYASTTAYTAKASGTAITTLNLTGSDAIYTFAANTNYTYLAINGNASATAITHIIVTYETAAAATYKVTYNANGATSGTAPTDATSYTSGTTVTVKSNSGTLAKTGHTFGGWNTNSSGTGTNYTAGSGTFTITDNTTLYAKWTAKQTNISINPNTSNHGTGSNVSVTATYGQALLSFTACTPATGYELAGYYTSATGGTKVIGKDGKLVASVSGYTDANAKWINESASLTLYAQYSAKDYTVTYAGNSGTTTCAGGTYTYNSSFAICSDKPTRTGYTFTGWSDGTNTYQPGANYTMPAKNVTFTAQWQILSYTVTWVVNGGESEETVNHGAKVEDAPDIDPNNLPCGQKFAGWTDKPITGTTDDAPNPLYKTAAEIPAIEKNQTFYAVFADYKQ